jgi:hypothetical protein
VVDKKTGEQGVIFQIRDIQLKSDTEAEVSGEYYEGSLHGSENTCTVKKEKGGWKVTKDKSRRIF